MLNLPVIHVVTMLIILCFTTLTNMSKMTLILPFSVLLILLINSLTLHLLHLATQSNMKLIILSLILDPFRLPRLPTVNLINRKKITLGMVTYRNHQENLRAYDTVCSSSYEYPSRKAVYLPKSHTQR